MCNNNFHDHKCKCKCTFTCKGKRDRDIRTGTCNDTGLCPVTGTGRVFFRPIIAVDLTV